MASMKITLVRGLVNSKPKQRATVQTLGLHRIGQSVVRDDSPANRGLVQVIRHLVTVEEID